MSFSGFGQKRAAQADLDEESIIPPKDASDAQKERYAKFKILLDLLPKGQNGTGVRKAALKFRENAEARIKDLGNFINRYNAMDVSFKAFLEYFPKDGSGKAAFDAAITYRDINEARIRDMLPKLVDAVGPSTSTPITSPPSRPTTSDSSVGVPPGTSVTAYADRQEFGQTLAAFRQHLDKVNNITQGWANNYLTGYFDTSNNLGCWMTTRRRGSITGRATTAEGEGYINCLLENQQCNGHSLSGLNIRFHQMAVIAKGNIAELRATFKGPAPHNTQDYEVSHLCHNHSCFNPQHIIVEPRKDNRIRQGCQGQSTIKNGDFYWHPCIHHGFTARMRCILPVREIPAGTRGWNYAT